MIGDLSPTSKFGTVIPLSIIGLLTGSKELLEDRFEVDLSYQYRKRHQQDKLVNSRYYLFFF
jgi:phospholipid-transporting ATPase